MPSCCPASWACSPSVTCQGGHDDYCGDDGTPIFNLPRVILIIGELLMVENRIKCGRLSIGFSPHFSFFLRFFSPATFSWGSTLQTTSSSTAVPPPGGERRPSSFSERLVPKFAVSGSCSRHFFCYYIFFNYLSLLAPSGALIAIPTYY